MKNFTTVLFIFLSYTLFSQNTVGLLSYDITRSYQGYTLIYPHNQANVYLLDNCGEVVHVWEDDENFRPGNTAYLRADGSLVKTKRDAGATGSSPIWAGGGGAIVEVRSWDNDLLASFESNDEVARIHHDIALTPEGTILMISWEAKSKEEAIQAGRDTMNLTEDKLWPEMIIEWDPMTDQIVWEWHVWDHLVQDFDSTKDNFGVIDENIGLVNINYDTNSGKADWLHANALDYNAELDHIMISIPTFGELWIIDHATTTAEAAGHIGGNLGKGGDLAYRVGNPQTYNKGDSTDQILFYQHDTHWVNEFIGLNDLNYGKVVCFNNRVGEDYSSIEIFNSSWEMYNEQYDVFQGQYTPLTFNEAGASTYTHPEPTAFHSTGLSSAQYLPNGNILACSGRQGYIIEMTPDNELVWEYVTPRKGQDPATQGDTLALNNNLTFRAFRYPLDYEAFDGRDLSSKGFIELEPNEEWCDRLVSTSIPEVVTTQIFPNPATDRVNLFWDSGEVIQITVIDILGRERMKTTGNGGMKYLDVSSLEPNIYFIWINDLAVHKLIVD